MITVLQVACLVLRLMYDLWKTAIDDIISLFQQDATNVLVSMLIFFLICHKRFTTLLLLLYQSNVTAIIILYPSSVNGSANKIELKLI